MQNEMPHEVRAALAHVRESFPDITHVFYNSQGYWLYVDDTNNAPDFDEKFVDETILQAGADAVPTLPAAFAWS